MEKKASHDRMIRFELFATAEATGLRTVEPAGGFGNVSQLHFLKLQCVKCGEYTIKDVGLYVVAPGEQGCSDRFGARKVRKFCYPKCCNPAHLCKTCGMLGSVELISREGTQVLCVMCVGYEPMAYCPGPGWVATTTAGEEVKLDYKSAGVFSAHDHKTGAVLGTATVQFDFKKVEA